MSERPGFSSFLGYACPSHRPQWKLKLQDKLAAILRHIWSLLTKAIHLRLVFSCKYMSSREYDSVLEWSGLEETSVYHLCQSPTLKAGGILTVSQSHAQVKFWISLRVDTAQLPCSMFQCLSTVTAKKVLYPGTTSFSAFCPFSVHLQEKFESIYHSGSWKQLDLPLLIFLQETQISYYHLSHHIF